MKTFNTHTDICAPAQCGKTSLIIQRRRNRIIRDQKIVGVSWKEDLHQADLAFTAIANPQFKVAVLSPDAQGYNPWKLSGELSTHAENRAKAIVENVSSDKTRDVPSYQEAAEPFFAYLALTNQTPFTAQRLFDDPKEWLLAAVRLPEPYSSAFRRIGRSKGKEFQDQVGTLRRRLRPFINSVALRKFTSSGKSAAEYLEEGSIFFNCSPGLLSFEAARVVLGVFVSDLLRWGVEHSTRYADTREPIYCDLDEPQEYAPPDLASGMDTILGSGLRLCLIHHHSRQFTDERLRDSIETNAGIKIIGGHLPYRVRCEYAEFAFARQINRDMHRQPQISYITYHEQEFTESHTESDFGDSITHGTRLHPYPEEVQTGWDDYSREQKVAFYAERLILPKWTFAEIFPDGKISIIKVPQLRTYLHDSSECLEFMKTHGTDSDEGENGAGIKPKKPRHP